MANLGTHVAIGNAIEVATKDFKDVPAEKWDEMGYNESHIHTDIVSTTDRTVTATLKMDLSW